MRRVSGLLYFIALQCLVSQAEVAPAGEPVVFRFGAQANGPCIFANGEFDGADVAASECGVNPGATSTWISVEGGSSTGTGTPGPIQIFGDMCLDVTNGVDEDGTKLQIWTCGEGNPNQQFSINSDLTIEWAGKGKCVDLTNGDTQTGTLLQVWTCVEGDANQIWTPEDPSTPPPPGIPEGGTVFFEIASTAPPPDLPLGCITSNTTDDGSAIIFDACDGTNFFLQEWSVIKGSTGQSGPIEILEGACLDVTDGVNEDGTFLQLWTCGDNNPNQQWQVNTNSTIIWAGTDKCVDLTNGDHTAGNKIQIWTCVEGDTNQIWTAEPISG